MPDLRDLLGQSGLDEAVEIAVQDGPGVAELDPRAVVLHQGVRVQYVAAYLIPPLRRPVLPAELLLLLLLLLDAQLEEAGAEDPHRDLPVAKLRALVLDGDHD